MSRAIRKKPKIYFQDSGHVEGDEGVRLENTVAVLLKKHVSWLQDVMGETVGLHYVRTKEKREVDLRYLSRKIPGASAFQLVQNLLQPQTIDSTHVVGAAGWLASLSA